MGRVRYMGISFVEIVTDSGKVVYVDPCMNRRMNPVSPVDLEEIDRVDLVAVTHLSAEHSSEAIPLAKRTGARMLCTRDMYQLGKSGGIPEDQMTSVVSGSLVHLAGVRVKCLRTEHGSFSVADDGRTMFDVSLGYIVYVREGVGIYHMGDTSIFGDLQLFGRLYHPKVMLVPIGVKPGGAAPLDPQEAAIAAGMVNPEIAIPIHYDALGDVEAPLRFAEYLAAEAPGVRALLLKAGDLMEI